MKADRILTRARDAIVACLIACRSESLTLSDALAFGHLTAEEYAACVALFVRLEGRK